MAAPSSATAAAAAALLDLPARVQAKQQWKQMAVAAARDRFIAYKQ
jgi:hypothetical protein